MLENLNPDQVRKLDSLVSEGVRVHEKIKLERDALNEAIKALAEEFDVKPKVIRKVITIAKNMNYADEEEEFEAVTEALRKIGRVA
jgi:predicted regulator of amino acid metabolism with ACT domain